MNKLKTLGHETELLFEAEESFVSCKIIIYDKTQTYEFVFIKIYQIIILKSRKSPLIYVCLHIISSCINNDFGS